MKAVTVTGGEFAVVDLPSPVPDRGQLRLKVLRCGICGSDLHARDHSDELADIAAEIGYDGLFRSTDAAVLGHEFSGEVLEGGPGTSLKPGTRVVSFPLVRRGAEVHTTGLSPSAPGGYAEEVLVEEAMSFAIPDGLSTEVATLTEPMAVGLHAVRRSGITKKQVAVVVGCGPVGLAVIGMLKATGVRTVVASDLSPGRRALATAVGADVVVDPAQDSPWDRLQGHGHIEMATDLFELGVSSMEKLRAIPLIPWTRVWDLAALAGQTTPKHPVVFECVGVPGLIDQVIAGAPLATKVVVVGVCMQPDTVRPAMAINKEIDLRFVLGYTPREFEEALQLLAAGKVNAAPLVTGTVGLHGVDTAFTALRDPEAHAKILIDPAREGREIQAPA
ncbi:zinc-binding dehydrogenase [Pseudonocardia sp. CA-107938]|uniref:zinc-binding dehydrogenase n=1 Tax=Pseudonocardia sp. CA-107938 TaxID=3240021 RepID=UPI003D949A0C